MEQRTNVDNFTEQLSATSAKRHPDDNLQQLEATSTDAATTDSLTRAEHLLIQQSISLDDPANQ